MPVSFTPRQRRQRECRGGRRSRVLIDCGLVRQLPRSARRPAGLMAVVLTHTHGDHWRDHISAPAKVPIPFATASALAGRRTRSQDPSNGGLASYWRPPPSNLAGSFVGRFQSATMAVRRLISFQIRGANGSRRIAGLSTDLGCWTPELVKRWPMSIAGRSNSITTSRWN